MEDNTHVKLKFDGYQHQIDLDLYTTVLLDYARIVREVNRSINPTTNIDIKVSATGEGSLDAFLSLASSVPPGALDFTSAVLGGIASVVTITAGIYNLRKHFAEKGKPAEATQNSNNEVLITHGDGKTTVVERVVYNISIGNAVVSDALDNTFRSLSKNESIVTGLEMYKGDSKLFSVPNSLFSRMAIVQNADNETVRKVVEQNEVLGVIRVILQQSATRRWEFVYRGTKISANIADTGFLDVLMNHSFSIGDELVVDLETTQAIDEKSGLWLNKSFTVTKVHQHRPRPSTEPMM